MANFSQNVNTFTDYTAEQQDIERRRKMAELLQQQGMQPIEQQTAGGYVVPTSWTQGLAKVLQQGMGGYQQGKLKEEQKALAGRARTEAMDWASGMPQGTPGTAESYTGDAGDELYHPAIQGQQPTKQELMAWALKGATSGNPIASQMAGLFMTEAMKHRDPIKIDAGDHWELRDPISQQLLQTIPKGVGPDAQLRSDTALQTHGSPSGSAILANQGANERFAGVSGNAQLGAQTAAAGQAITMRGQNLVDARSRETLSGVDMALSPEAKTNAAARYNIDGTLPPLGLGKAGAQMRKEILDEAAVLQGKNGLSPDEQRIQQIGNKANTAALSKLQQQATMVGAFEKNFTRNADIALEYSTKVDKTGVPLINKWINAGKRAVTGDPDLSAYDAVIKSTVNEYTKIISGAMGNTPMAEQEVRRVESLLTAAQTPAQVREVVKMMKRETQNRMKGFDEEKASLRGSMTAGSQNRRATDKPGSVLKFDSQGNPMP